MGVKHAQYKVCNVFPVTARSFTGHFREPLKTIQRSLSACQDVCSQRRSGGNGSALMHEIRPITLDASRDPLTLCSKFYILHLMIY
jgi:hypothetical protein